MRELSEIFEILTLPTTIYHYTSSGVAIENILPKGKILMNHLKNTNDPKEYKSLHFISTGWGDFNDSREKIGSTIVRLDEIRKNGFQILSFSCNKKELGSMDPFTSNSQMNLLGCCKPRMWSQYGENHRGVIFAFNSIKLLETLKSNQNLYSDIYSQRVSYDQLDLKSELFLDSNSIQDQEIDAYCLTFLIKNRETIFFNKNPDYKDEDEFRIILRTAELGRVAVPIKESLIAVVVGDRFPIGLLPSLRFFCNQINVRPISIYWDAGMPIILDCNNDDLNKSDN